MGLLLGSGRAVRDGLVRPLLLHESSLQGPISESSRLIGKESWHGSACIAKFVCVTGAGGFVASWLLKLLLSKGFTVHATVRDPDNKKNDHLMKLEGAAQNLKLFKADLLDYDSVYAAIEGCHGVFHVASPVPSSSVSNPQVDLVAPAVTGTLNVLKACSQANVKKAVVVSSITAIYMSPNWPKGQVKDETCWSDKDYCRTTNNWYCYSKTVAEMEALEYAKKSGLNVVTVCPGLILGPMLQQTTNSSSLILIKLLKEGHETIEDRLAKIVDVRDVAEALILVYEKEEAEGRYICVAHPVKKKEMVEVLKKIYPDYKYPKSFTPGDEGDTYNLEKLKMLGWRCRPLEETFVDAVGSYKKLGILD